MSFYVFATCLLGNSSCQPEKVTHNRRIPSAQKKKPFSKIIARKYHAASSGPTKFRNMFIELCCPAFSKQTVLFDYNPSFFPSNKKGPKTKKLAFAGYT